MNSRLFPILLVLTGLLPQVLFGQAKKWADELDKFQGIVKAQKAFELAPQAAASGDLESAVKLADFGADQAISFADSDLAARCLNQKGKFLMQGQRKKAFGKDKTAVAFRRSMELLDKSGSTNYALMLDNLRQLRALAEANKDSDELIKIDGKMARINAILGDKTKADQLQNQVSELAQTNQNLSKTTSKLSQLQAAMSTELRMKNEAIVSLTEAQAKKELELANQKLMLDSLSFRRSLDSLALGQQQMIARQAELELSQQKAQKNFSLAVAALGLLLALGIGIGLIRQKMNNRILAEKNIIIQAERARSEELLLNILPVAVAAELKKNGVAEPRYYEEVSVLFSDFKGFSKIAAQLSPADLVKELDYCFKAFDEIVGRKGIEKIKTIGDAYMCASGFQESKSAPKRMVEAALEMQLFLENWNIERDRFGQPRFDARIGVHTGPVVAGVVGARKFAWDIWGDTVNIAARMEETCEVGRVNISGHTWEMVKNDFPSVHRGRVPVKNRGEFEMYFVG